jgi:putative intracellular protease/amidase
MKLSIVLFDGFTTLDVVGGFEVLSRIPGMQVEIVAPTPGTIAVDTRWLGIVAYRSLAEVERTDILYVPGGPGGVALEEDEEFLGHLRRIDATSRWTIGICNGVGLLAAAGLLEGRAATTNFFYRERLAARGVTVIPERYHRDGKYVTGAGVSASLDAGLFLAGLIGGETVMRAIGLGVEYFPAPPYPERTPEEIAEPIAAIVRAYEASGGAEDLKRSPAFEAVGHGHGHGHGGALGRA